MSLTEFIFKDWSHTNASLSDLIALNQMTFDLKSNPALSQTPGVGAFVQNHQVSKLRADPRTSSQSPPVSATQSSSAPHIFCHEAVIWSLWYTENTFSERDGCLLKLILTKATSDQWPRLYLQRVNGLLKRDVWPCSSGCMHTWQKHMDVLVDWFHPSSPS